MGLLIVFIIIIINSSALSLMFDKNLENNVFPTTCIVVFITYLFGIVGYLYVSIYVLLLLTIFSLIYIFKSYKNKKSLSRERLFRPVLIYLGIALLVALFFSYNFYITMWDEFSHWGTYVKNMYVYDALQGLNFTDTTGYPPFVSIFQYLCMKLSFQFNEATLLSSLLMLCFSAFSFLIKPNHFKKASNICFMVLLIFIPMIFFSDYLSSIYVDAFMGVVLGISVLVILLEKVSLFKIFIISIYSSALILTKDFALVCVGIIYFILLLEIFYFKRNEYFQFYKNKMKSNKLLLLIIVLLLILPFLFFVSWRMYLSNFDFIVSNVSKIGFAFPSYFTQVVNGFMAITTKNGIATGSNFLYIPTFTYFLLFTIISFYAILQLKAKDKARTTSKMLVFSMIVTFALYCLGLMLSYIFIFSEDEALRLASYGRYILTVLIALFIIAIGYIAEQNRLNNFVNRNPIFLVCAVAVLFVDTTAIYNAGINFFHRDSSKAEFKQAHYDKLDIIKNNAKENQKIFYVNMSTDGFEYYVAKYHLTPFHIQNQMWNMKINNSDKNLMSLDEFKNILNDFEFVFIDNFNEEFVSSFSSLFGNSLKNNSLYKINKENFTFTLVE